MKKNAKRTPALNVDEYLDRLPAEVQSMLEKIRRTILSVAPKAEERISYQMPTYKYQGYLISFAAFTNHCSLFAISKQINETYKKELEPYKTSTATLRFTVEKPIPVTLVKKLVRAKLKENALKFKIQDSKFKMKDLKKKARIKKVGR